MLKARLAKIHNDSSLTDIQVTSPPSSPLEKRVSVVKNTVEIGRKYDMSSLVRKPTMWFSEQVRHKPSCTSTEDG